MATGGRSRGTSGAARRGGRAPRGPMHEASFTLEFGRTTSGRRRLAAVAAALSPEVDGDAEGAPGAAGDRVTMRRLRGGTALEVTVKSASLPSLRAALNAHMRMAALAQGAAGAALPEEE